MNGFCEWNEIMDSMKSETENIEHRDSEIDNESITVIGNHPHKNPMD